MNNELKPCPFCGEQASGIKVLPDQFMIACCNDNCECSNSIYDTIQEAIKAWNTRSNK